MNMIGIAVAEAVDRHSKEQRDNNGTPFIWHPMRVSGRYQIAGNSTEEGICACWLHDVPENCAKDSFEATFLLTHIAEITNQRVADYVRGLTDPCVFDAELKFKLRPQREAAFREFIAKQSLDVQRIKLFDRIDNLDEMTSDMERGLERRWTFMLDYADESELLAQTIGRADSKLLSEITISIRRVRTAANIIKYSGAPSAKG